MKFFSRVAGLVAIAAILVVPLAGRASAARQGGSAAGMPIIQASAGQASSPSADFAAARQNPCQGFYCDFRNTGFTNLCFQSQGDEHDWVFGNTSCRNVDESIRNLTGVTLRLWFSPNLAGAHVCLNAGRQISNLGNFRFNSGSGKAGFGQTVENNVASSSLDTSGPCSNPI